MSDLIECDKVSKKFCKDLKRSLWYGVKDVASEICSGQVSGELRKDEFWALRDISFKVKKGECLGLLGRNGAGKTTLLKILSGLIKPDHGAVKLKGTVGGLIALGAGFNGILTGRENIKVNGSILGHSSKQIKEKMEEIISFAELEEFIDAPVQTYSSGMSVRLGFSIAVNLAKPDILLLDEVLAVGDIGFVIKCLNAVTDLIDSTAVIFVSHNLQFVSRFCNKVLLMDKGVGLKLYDEVDEGITDYLSSFSGSAQNVHDKGLLIIESKLKTQNIELECNKDGLLVVGQGDDVILSMRFRSEMNFEGRVHVTIQDFSKAPIAYYKDDNLVKFEKGENCFEVNLGELDLNSGRYSFIVGVTTGEKSKCISRNDLLSPFIVKSEVHAWGNIVRSVSVKAL